MICSGRYAEVAKEASMLGSLKGGGGALAIGFIFGSGGITVDGGDLAPVRLVEGEVVNAEVVPTAPPSPTTGAAVVGGEDVVGAEVVLPPPPPPPAPLRPPSAAAGSPRSGPMLLLTSKSDDGRWVADRELRWPEREHLVAGNGCRRR